MRIKRILIAGIGNIFLGDDGFGVAVVGELAKQQLPPEVRIVDSGIRGRDLAFTLLDGFELVILIDAVQRGEKPGTLYVIEPDDNETAAPNLTFDPHKLDPLAVLQYARSLGAMFGPVIIIGCQPEGFGEDSDAQTGLSVAVQKAVPEASKLIVKFISDFQATPAA